MCVPQCGVCACKCSAPRHQSLFSKAWEAFSMQHICQRRGDVSSVRAYRSGKREPIANYHRIYRNFTGTCMHGTVGVARLPFSRFCWQFVQPPRRRGSELVQWRYCSGCLDRWRESGATKGIACSRAAISKPSEASCPVNMCIIVQVVEVERAVKIGRCWGHTYVGPPTLWAMSLGNSCFLSTKLGPCVSVIQ